VDDRVETLAGDVVQPIEVPDREHSAPVVDDALVAEGGRGLLTADLGAPTSWATNS